MPTADLRATVAVVSRGRPQALRRCLLALSQQYHPAFEVVVVADEAGCRAAGAFPAKVLRFQPANIAAARNAAIELAAGEVVAFIDDDACAEPTWLARLLAPFAEPQVAAAGGHVLGRNGISLQWGTRLLDAAGRSHAVADPPASGPGFWWLPQPAPGQVPRAEGTNMAWRREVLLALGGFDPGFALFHDESELCWRLGLSGSGRVASVPGALVHHGFLPSALRRADRVPRDLAPIGAGCARFLSRHAPQLIEATRRALREEQRMRLRRHLRAGRLLPHRARALLRSFDAGFAQGLAAARQPDPAAGCWLSTQGPPPFRPFARPPEGARLLAGLWPRFGAVQEQARIARAAGEVVTLLLLWPGLRAHRVQFGEDGIWYQRGGLWGRVAREGSRVQPRSLRAHLALARERAERVCKS